MPTYLPGAPCWIDLTSTDIDRARDFYGQLLGWQAEPGSAEFGGYFMFTHDGVPVAGGMPAPAGTPGTDQWNVYLNVPDAAATLTAAQHHGASVVVEAMPVADLGTMGMLVDPAGAPTGIWQAGTFAGCGAIGDPGTPAWFELHTRGYDAAAGFYRDVFGWDLHPMGDDPQFRYATFGEGESAVAGLMADDELPDGVAGRWSVYFPVADADAAAEQVGALGGSVQRAPQDSPFGRITVVTDSTGAHLCLIGPNIAAANTADAGASS
jgi:predicted enzyme related to lactoylglutathione lyase